MLEAGAEVRVERFEDAGALRDAASRRVDQRRTVRRVRRVRRRLGDRRRAVHPRPAPSSAGGARACSAAAPITGDASRSASGPTTSAARASTGLGDDWPITYDDVKPYYDDVDRWSASSARTRACGIIPTASSCRRRKPRCYELMVKKASDKLNITCIPSRLSIYEGAARPPACHYCGQCNRGCQAKANFSSPDVLIGPALATGSSRHHERDGARGHDRRRRPATGVSYIDKNNGLDEHVRARVVVLAASAMESARMLLNSKSSKFPQGLANSSGIVGKYLTDTTGASVPGTFRRWWITCRTITTASAACMCTAVVVDNKKLDFPRGYHIEPGGGRGCRRSASWAAS